MAKKLAIKKMMACLLAAGLLMSSAVGCSGGGGTGGSGGTSSSGEGSQASSAASQESGGGSGSKTLTVWHTYTAEDDRGPFEATLKAFEDVNSDVTMEVVSYSTADIITNLNMAVVAGTMPDLAILDNPKFASLVETGVFAPITDWFYGWEDSKNFKENCLDMGTIDGELYGILYDPCGLALWANKQMLADAGYDAAPTNWEEFEEIAMACTDPANNVYGFATSTRTEEEGSTFQHGAFIYTSGTTLYDLSTQGALDYFNMVDRLYAAGAISMESIDWTQGDAYNQFIAGNAAMCLSGDWNINTYLDPATNTLGIEALMAPIPAYDDDHQGITLFGGEMIGMTNNCEDVELAYDFLEFWLSRDMMKQVDLAITKNSGRTDLSNEDIYAESAPEILELRKFYEDIVDNAVPRGPDAKWVDISDAFRDCLQAIALDEADVDTAVSTAVAEIDKICAE